MKDSIQKQIPSNAVYKEVVIVGNGPSGISLSYMLAGHWPYWKPNQINSHPDELLRARLNYADSNKSLVQQDFVSLANGLEGRTTNPVSLLLDSLNHPGADIGFDLPCMLEYRYHPEKEIDHVVLGRGLPGGSWHRMDPNLRTLSLSDWMSLPNLNFNEWNETHPQCHVFVNNLCQTSHSANDDVTDKVYELTTNNNSNLKNCDTKCSNSSISNNNNSVALLQTTNQTKSQTNENEMESENVEVIRLLEKRRIVRTPSKDVESRALVSRVAEYYQQYVKLMGLNKYFLNDTIVTSVTPLKDMGDMKWLVNGYCGSISKPFSYVCKNLVLANGASDIPNRLGLRGEEASKAWVKYELPSLEKAIDRLTVTERMNLKPVVIIGAGLSAADAITTCRAAGIQVYHVYRNRTAGLDKLLPENIYPEYFEVHNMMKNANNRYDLYKALPEHTVCDIQSSNGKHYVTVQHLKTGESRTIQVSYCTVLIGSRPDLRLLSITSNATTTTLKKDNKSMENNNTNNADTDPLRMLSRKLLWLKNLCAKCRRINNNSNNNVEKNSKFIIESDDSETDCNSLYKMCRCDMKREKSASSNEKGLGLGENPKKPIDCKNNPVAVDKYTNRVLSTSEGLYALGPLVGDNFVRFIPGGALAITSALHKLKEND